MCLETRARRLRWSACGALAAWLLAGGGRLGGAPSDPFEFFAPWVGLSAAERAKLDEDQVVVRRLQGGDGQMAVFVATRLNAEPDALVEWTRAIAELKRSQFVLAIGRFSNPPVPADLEGLHLDDRDLAAIRTCIPGNCALKLSQAEIESLRAAALAGGDAWRAAVEDRFRRVMIARVDAYRAGGLVALEPNADRNARRTADQVFASIVDKSPYLTRVPYVEAWLRTYPRTDDSRVEWFFYWSKEHYGSGKPVISITHVGIARPEPNRHPPAVVIMGKQIFATHYSEGALGLTMVTRDAETGRSYLVYINRSTLDLFRGLFGGLARSVFEGRLERQAPLVVRGLRMRLESGSPPGETVASPPSP
jgi:hypothetical protein